MARKSAARGGIITPVQYNDFVRVGIIGSLLLLVACAPAAVSPTPVPLDLRPYSTITPSATIPPAGAVIVPSTPPASPTPFKYSIQAGDTLSQLAERFHVSLDALLAANPGVNPNALSVGQSLTVPGSPEGASDGVKPTPVSVPVEQVACHPIADGGLWCFALVRDQGANPIENVTARLELIGSDGNVVSDQVAILPLNLLLPGESLPLSAYFPPGVPATVKPQVQVLTANEVPSGDQRYLPAQVRNASVKVAASGLSGQVTGQVSLPEGSTSARLVWVAAVAYDDAGNVIGFRRWEDSGGLTPSAPLSFTFMIASVAGRIDRVEFAVEARP